MTYEYYVDEELFLIELVKVACVIVQNKAQVSPNIGEIISLLQLVTMLNLKSITVVIVLSRASAQCNAARIFLPPPQRERERDKVSQPLRKRLLITVAASERQAS